MRPRLLRTRLGPTWGPDAGEIAAGAQRVVSGSVLDGRSAAGEVHGYLGRHHLQVSVLAEAVERELFGWIMPGSREVLDLGRRARRLEQPVLG
jgi:Na+-transporting NADH:ubiquinone oxidoreductase subunit A